MNKLIYKSRPTIRGGTGQLPPWNFQKHV